MAHNGSLGRICSIAGRNKISSNANHIWEPLVARKCDNSKRQIHLTSFIWAMPPAAFTSLPFPILWLSFYFGFLPPLTCTSFCNYLGPKCGNVLKICWLNDKMLEIAPYKRHQWINLHMHIYRNIQTQADRQAQDFRLPFALVDGKSRRSILDRSFWSLFLCAPKSVHKLIWFRCKSDTQN